MMLCEDCGHLVELHTLLFGERFVYVSDDGTEREICPKMVAHRSSSGETR